MILDLITLEHLIFTDYFGCTATENAEQLHETSSVLTEIAEVDSHIACLHYCQFGTEDTCNFIEYEVDNKSCFLCQVPSNQQLQMTHNPDTSSDRVICMISGELKVIRILL